MDSRVDPPYGKQRVLHRLHPSTWSRSLIVEDGVVHVGGDAWTMDAVTLPPHPRYDTAELSIKHAYITGRHGCSETSWAIRATDMCYEPMTAVKLRWATIASYPRFILVVADSYVCRPILLLYVFSLILVTESCGRVSNVTYHHSIYCVPASGSHNAIWSGSCFRSRGTPYFFACMH
jgi:hypothetical protein